MWEWKPCNSLESLKSARLPFIATGFVNIRGLRACVSRAFSYETVFSRAPQRENQSSAETWGHWRCPLNFFIPTPHHPSTFYVNKKQWFINENILELGVIFKNHLTQILSLQDGKLKLDYISSYLKATYLEPRLLPKCRY